MRLLAQDFLGDDVDPRAGQSLAGEFDLGGVKDRAPRALGIANWFELGQVLAAWLSAPPVFRLLDVAATGMMEPPSKTA